ncbi:hypothetical protein [Marasmitruncus massiliensis]|uniref:hypothetical protein n=1 Tax=Marasmitruncus massiliensis TaxID=1944642 RepID=UPI0015E08F39|nr:hypothetical protein [Marasmitruncus massiliensis]
MEKQDLFDKEEVQTLLYGKSYVVTNYFPKLRPDDYRQRISQIACRLYEILDKRQPPE